MEQSQFIEKSRPTHREPLWYTTTCYDPPRWQTVENFRFGAATVENGRTTFRLVQSVEKTRRQLFHVAQYGRVILIHVVFDG